MNWKTNLVKANTNLKAESPSIAKALMNGKANLEAKDKVETFGTIIGEPHMYSLATRVFVEAWQDSSDVGCAML